VFSKRTCRVPNELNKVALNKKSWFIHLYLDHRKQWLEKIAGAGKLMREEEAKKKQETDPSFKPAELESNLLGIEKYQGKAYPAKTGWTREDARSRASRVKMSLVRGLSTRRLAAPTAPRLRWRRHSMASQARSRCGQST
jgi:hypothetical protein